MSEAEHNQNCAEKICTYWKRQGFAGIKARATYAEIVTRPGHFMTLWRIESNVGPQGFPPK